MINETKPNPSISNTDKVSVGETWFTIPTTWANEVRTWIAVSKLITNSSLIGITPIWSERSLIWQMTAPWLSENTGITNTSKP